jgi:hypothetical protein
MGLIYMSSNNIYYRKYRKYKSKYLTLNKQMRLNPNSLLQNGGFEAKSYKIILFDQYDIIDYRIFSSPSEIIKNAKMIQNYINDFYGYPLTQTDPSTQDKDDVISVNILDLYNRLNGKAYETTFDDSNLQLIRITQPITQLLPLEIFFGQYESMSPLAKSMFLNSVIESILEDHNIQIINNLDKTNLGTLPPLITYYSSKKYNYATNQYLKIKNEALSLLDKFKYLDNNDRIHILNKIIKQIRSDPMKNKEIISQLDGNNIQKLIQYIQGGAQASLPKIIQTIPVSNHDDNYRYLIINNFIMRINDTLKRQKINKTVDTALILMEGLNPYDKYRVYEILFLQDYLKYFQQ